MTKLYKLWNNNSRFRHWAKWTILFTKWKGMVDKFYCLDCNQGLRILSQEHMSHKNVKLFLSVNKRWTIWGEISTPSRFRIFRRADSPEVLQIGVSREGVGRDTAIEVDDF